MIWHCKNTHIDVTPQSGGGVGVEDTGKYEGKQKYHHHKTYNNGFVIQFIEPTIFSTSSKFRQNPSHMYREICIDLTLKGGTGLQTDEIEYGRWGIIENFFIETYVCICRFNHEQSSLKIYKNHLHCQNYFWTLSYMQDTLKNTENAVISTNKICYFFYQRYCVVPGLCYRHNVSPV